MGEFRPGDGKKLSPQEEQSRHEDRVGVLAHFFLCLTSGVE
jgi:hypothetical protein